MNQPVPLIPLALSLPLLAFWAWMGLHMTRNSRLTDSEKTTWALAFVFLNIFAAAWYYYTEYCRG